MLKDRLIVFVKLYISYLNVLSVLNARLIKVSLREPYPSRASSKHRSPPSTIESLSFSFDRPWHFGVIDAISVKGLQT